VLSLARTFGPFVDNASGGSGEREKNEEEGEIEMFHGDYLSNESMDFLRSYF
jgi:hypothetical protein